jgi:hypothetical protein
VVLMPRRWHQPGDEASASRRGWWQESPITKKSTKETVKTIARGMPGVTVVTNSYAFYFCIRGCGCIERPAFPAPSIFGVAHPCAQLGRIVSREARIRGSRRAYPLLTIVD